MLVRVDFYSTAEDVVCCYCVRGVTWCRVRLVCVCVLCALTAVANDFAWAHLPGVGVDVVQRHHYVHEAFPVSVRAHRACAPSRFEPCREDAAVAEFVSLGQLSEVFVVLHEIFNDADARFPVVCVCVCVCA